MANQSKWTTTRALYAHLTLLVVFPGFFALAYWQFHRAISGNELSWAYTFEWPIFAFYAVYLWWTIVNDDPHVEVRIEERPMGAPGIPKVINDSSDRCVSEGDSIDEAQYDDLNVDDNEEEEELKKYNEYLKSLNESGMKKRW